MSFHKRSYDIKILRSIFDKDGIEGIEKSFINADSFSFSDKESSQVFEYLNKMKIKKAIKILEQ